MAPEALADDVYPERVRYLGRYTRLIDRIRRRERISTFVHVAGELEREWVLALEGRTLFWRGREEDDLLLEQGDPANAWNCYRRMLARRRIDETL